MLVVFALAMPVLLGMAAIVVDVGNLFVEKRSLQKAADASALAAAQRLPGGACDPACQSGVATLAGNYRAANLGDGNSGPLPVCDASTTSNCHRIVGSTRVEVILTKEVSTFFGGLVGKSSYTVRARAVAGPFSYTSTTPGSTEITPGTTSAGTPALVFAASTACSNASSTRPLKFTGAGGTFQGAVVSNGGVQIQANDVTGDELIWGFGADDTVCVDTKPGWNDIHEASKIYDWPVSLPVCTPACDTTTAASKTVVTSVTAEGQPPKTCTAKGDGSGNWDVPNAPLAPGLYCAGNRIRINGVPPGGFASVGFVAPEISWVGDGVVTGFTGIYPGYLGLAFYAYGTSGINMSGSGKSFAGAVFAPYGPAALSGSGSTSACGSDGGSCGFFEAFQVELNGSNQHWQGLGPGFGGITTPGTTTIIDPVTNTTGTGSNLDE